MIKKAKNTLPWTYITSDLNREEIVGTFYEKKKKLQKTNKKKWKGSDHLFDSWINK